MSNKNNNSRIPVNPGHSSSTTSKSRNKPTSSSIQSEFQNATVNSSTSTSISKSSRNKPPTSLLQHEFQQKYTSHSECFLKFLKSVGYEAPKNLKPEHLDYLFKSKKTTEVVNAIMTKFTPANVLSPDEVEAYEHLKREGLLLFGEDLERAVEHRRALDRRNSDKNNSDELKTEELKRLIALREKEIADIQKRKEIMRRLDAARREPNPTKEAISAHCEKESSNLKTAVLVAKKRIKDKAQGLKEVREDLIKKLEPDDNNKTKFGDQLMVEWDWETFLENEDALNQELREFGQEFIPTLLKESERPIKQTDESQLSEAVIQKLAKFERIRHSIVYEQVRKAKITRKTVAAQVAIEVMDDVRRNGMDMSRSEEELDESITLLEVEEKNKFDQVLQSVRTNALQEVDSSFQGLIESKNLAKKRLELSLSGMYDILEAQTVRIDLMSKLMLAESQPYNQLKDALSNLDRELAALDLDGRGNTLPKKLTPQGQQLSQIFQQLGYPDDTIHSTVKTFNVINKIYDTIARDEVKLAIRANAEEEEELKKISRRCQDLRHKWQKLKVAAIPSHKVERLKAEVEEKQKLLKEQKSSATEIVLEKKHLLADMKRLLETS